MGFDLLNSTGEQRNARVSECHRNCAKLEGEINDIKKKSAELKNANSEKISRRDEVYKKINSVKSKGKWLIILGIVLAVAALAYLTDEDLQILRIAGAVVGVAVIILGIIVRGGKKKHDGELAQADAALSAYDSTQEAYGRQIEDREEEIQSYKKEVEKIRDYESNQKYYQWEATTETGHVAIFVTSEAHPFEDSPREPKEGKKYDSFTLKTLEIYINDMLYGSGTKVYSSNQTGMISLAELEDEGTQKLQIRIVYEIANNQFERISKPIPMRKDKPSEFIWYHVSTCGKGTEIYVESYKTFDELREAVNLSKTEIMRYI